MSARGVVQAAVVAVLTAAEGLVGVAVFDAPPVRAALPYVAVDEPLLSDWSTKSWSGREGRLTILAHDGGERPGRLRALVEAVEAALASLPVDLGEGWRIATLTFVRSRIVRAGDRWLAASEFQIRMWKEQ